MEKAGKEIHHRSFSGFALIFIFFSCFIDIACNIMDFVRAAYVLDTDVVVAALRSDKGASRQLLLAALNRHFELLLSVPLIIEYEAVLSRPEHLAASGLSSVEVSRVLDDVAAVAKPVRLAFRWRPQLGDPDDDMVLETAVNGNAHAIVTFNQRDFLPAARDFNCDVILPALALQKIRS